ncbi:unnamed protein product [Macrosiphum euphorbiae]|uniref:Uncharacterized protein n=1 Tax=Macrosiphum euphorbiae TaxID=13131 RepID=A0AAV0VIQ7_9HEMI|nr:unnamed protein product [Macrosiphum euphorbiae]
MNSYDTRNIRPEFHLEFERRHAVLEPYIDHIKNFMLNHIVYERYDIAEDDIFLSGECAAWLLGRFDKFSRIDVLIDIRHPQEFRLTATPEAFFDGLKRGLPKNSDFPGELENMFGLSSIIVNYLEMDISFVFIHGTLNYLLEHFNLSISAVLVNLYNLSMVYTAECPCDYEGQCMTSSETRKIIYPLLFEASSVVQPSDKNISMCTRAVTTPLRLRGRYHTFQNLLASYGPRMHLREFFCDYSIFARYAELVNARVDETDRPLSFYIYPDCTACMSRREKLTRWAYDHWVRRTYHPITGYGYREAKNRFNKSDSIDLPIVLFTNHIIFNVKFHLSLQYVKNYSLFSVQSSQNFICS